MNMTRTSSPRRGTILIIVSGISALLAAMALTFLINAKADTRETEHLIHNGQARIMLGAACAYILEASRIGWEPMTSTDPQGLVPRRPISTEHVEAFGWIDVRNGSLGPQINTREITDAKRDEFRDQFNNMYPVDLAPTPNPFPVGKAKRFPMYVMTRPPFAISQRVAENPIDPKIPVSKHLRNPDPQPAVKDITEWMKGEVLPGVRPDGMPNYKYKIDSYGKSWFRLLREKSGASFIVTCGAGGTLGYRSWQEVLNEDLDLNGVGDDEAYFGNQEIFEALREAEVRLWYRVEWNAAVVVQEMNYFREGAEHSGLLSGFSYQGGGHTRRDSPYNSGLKTIPRYGNNYSAQWQASNMCGSIQYIQRLRNEPDIW